jgi:poly-D-alanine transfer protein DltD
MEPLKPDHQRLREMTQIIDILRELDVNLIFYITPVNVQRGEAYLPDEFHKRVSANTAVIKTVLRKHDVDVLDLSESLPDAYFSRDVYTNAHLAQQGRLFVAQNLSEILMQNNRRLNVVPARPIVWE